MIKMLKNFLCLLALSLFAGCASISQSPRQPVLERIAFGSCINQGREQRVWDDVFATQPQLFIFGGDNAYIDTNKPERFKEVYDQLNATPQIQTLRETCPILGVWDDHDYGRNDAGKTYTLKDDSKLAYLNFFDVPTDQPTRARDGIYQSYTYGPKGQRVQVILLDTRWFRDDIIKDKRSGAEKKKANTVGWYVPHTDTSKTLLGAAQWTWLEEKLTQEADVRILVSSIQLAVDGRGMEGWANFPHERQRLFELIEKTRATGLIALSGDVHFCELSRRDDAPYPLYDFTSSSVGETANRVWSRSTNPFRVGNKVKAAANFGTVDIDWNAKSATGKTDPIITLTARGDKGTTHFSHAIPLSTLGWPTK